MTLTPPPRADIRNKVIEQIPPGAVCAEVGSWKGDFAARILTLAAPAELHLVDPWYFDANFPARWYGGAGAKSQADMDAIHEGVRQRFAAHPEVRIHRLTSVAGRAQFADGTFDWVYIDGDHSYDAVTQDILAWLPKITPGGQLACDDYFWRDEAGRLSVKDAVDDFMRAQPEGAVRGEKYPGGQFVIRVIR